MFSPPKLKNFKEVGTNFSEPKKKKNLPETNSSHLKMDG